MTPSTQTCCCCFTRYRRTPIWNNLAVAYFFEDVYVEVESASSNGLCAAYDPARRAFPLVACEDPSHACNCGYLCEAVDRQHGPAGHPEPTRGPELANIPGTDTRNEKIKVAVCPSGHFTHDFLSCDSRSACWASGVRGAQSCLAAVRPPPPSFSCSNGVSWVPYPLVCDHRQDCPDTSDESFCHFPQCVATVERPMFQCENLQVG